MPWGWVVVEIIRLGSTQFNLFNLNWAWHTVQIWDPLIFRQHVASIYGFVCFFVHSFRLFCSCVQKNYFPACCLVCFAAFFGSNHQADWSNPSRVHCYQRESKRCTELICNYHIWMCFPHIICPNSENYTKPVWVFGNQKNIKMLQYDGRNHHRLSLDRRYSLKQ